MTKYFGKCSLIRNIIVIALIILFALSILYFCDFTVSNDESKIVFEGYSHAAAQDVSEIQEIMSETDGNAEAIIKLTNNDDFIQNLVLNTRKSISADSSEKEVDAAIARHRLAMKNYFSSNNRLIAEKLDLYKLDVIISDYSPYVYIDFNSNTISKNNLNSINDISKSDYVEKIYIRNNLIPEEQGMIVDKYGDSTDIKKFVNPGTLTGNGIKIGIMEPGVIDKKNTNFSNINVEIKSKLTNTVSDHATIVASIAAGYEGVAKNASLLSVTCTNMVSDFNWLYDNGVNVLNCSFAYKDLYNGAYSSQAAFFDWQVENNLLPIVAAAGNSYSKEYPTDYVSSPAIGYNVLAVGASSSNNSISEYSCYKTHGVSKPNLVAPGEYRIPNTISSNDVIVGTSYASPLVAGIVALLMEYKPALKTYPELLTCILSASAKEMPNYPSNEASGLNSKAGAGIVNFEAAKTLVDSYLTVHTSTGDAPGVKKNYSIGLKKGQTIQVSMVHLNSGNYNGTANSMNYYKLYIKDILTGEIVVSASSNSNAQFLRYKSPKLGFYQIIAELRNTAVKYDQGAMHSYVY